MGGSGAVANEKETMQDLNDRLAAYLEQVRSLERENRRLETQIREFMAQKGPSAHDWSPQWELIEELRDKVGARGRLGLNINWEGGGRAELCIRGGTWGGPSVPGVLCEPLGAGGAWGGLEVPVGGGAGFFLPRGAVFEWGEGT